MNATPPILSLRVTPDERDLLETAAAQARTTLSDFVRRTALEAAELAIIDRKLVTIPAADWDAFEAWAAAPAKDIPALRKLAGTRPAWEG